MSLAGATLGFIGLAFTDRTNIQVLEQPIRLDYHHMDVKLRTMTAWYLGALRKAMDRLRRYYEFDLPQLETHGSAIGSDGTKVCVKFATRYSRDTHIWCTSMGIAPPLRGFEALAGGWFMVVMDRIDDVFKPLDTSESRLTNELHELVLKKTTLLHQAGYVHGDLRNTNLMVRKDGQSGFMLVDFDWVGKIGEVCYPMNMNTDPVLGCPPGTYDGEIIKADHDMDMLQNIFVGLRVD